MLGIRTARAWGVASITLGSVMLVLILVLGALWQAYHDYSGQIESLEPRIARLIGITQSHGQLLDANLQINTQLEELMYPATQDTTATGTTLQQVVRNVVQTAGMEVAGSQILPSRAEGSLEFVSLNLTLNGDLPSLEALLFGLPSVRPLVFVDSMVVQPARTRGVGAAQDVMVQMTITSVRALP